MTSRERALPVRRPDPSFWKGRSVFLTGHTGFKGSWLSLWLSRMGARVHGYALPPPTDPSLFRLASVDELLAGHATGDVRDLPALRGALASSKAETVIHMAAQPLVRESYRDPLETYSVNVMGTATLLEAVRSVPSVRAVVNVTSDKCYENREWHWGYRESDPMGGFDPYSSSKGCSELVTAAWRRSFFPPLEYGTHGVAVASARAGNVIGGGDFAPDRLLPDFVRAVTSGQPVRIRNPRAIRPWQHVLEPLSGYLLLAERLVADGPAFGDGWNFGPDEGETRDVEWVARRFCEGWEEGARYEPDGGDHPHEASHLRLDSSRARDLLSWRPRWSVGKAVAETAKWTRAWREGASPRGECLRQVEEFEAPEGDA
jgi:CDP-glucose 4,6-dehydratase